MNSCKLSSDENDEGSKKFQKCKYEIELQRHKITQLQEVISSRKKNFFPQECIEMREKELSQEKQKFECMIRKLIELQKLMKDDESAFKNISTEFDEKSNKYPPKTPSGISKISGIAGCDLAEDLMAGNEALHKEQSR